MDNLRLGIDINGNNRDLLASIAGSKAALASLRGEQGRLDAATRSSYREQNQLTRALREQSRALSSLKLEFFGVRNAIRNLGVRTLVTGFNPAVAIVDSLAASLGTLTTSLGSFSIAAAAFGQSGFIGTLQAMGVAALAFDNNLKKALTMQGEDKAKAMAKLTSEARSFVTEIDKLGVTFQRFQKLAQIGIFPGIVQGIKNAHDLIKPLEQITYDTAQAMGYLAERAGDVFGKRGADIERVGERNIVTMRRLGDGAINVADAFIDIARAADPIIGFISRDILHFTERFNANVKEARKDGSLASLFDEARISWQNWTHNLGLGLKLLGNIFTAALPSAHRMEKAIGNTLEDWVKWTGSTKGQNFLKKYFEDGLDVLGEVMDFFGKLGEAWVRMSQDGKDNAIDFVKFLGDDLLPTLETIVTGLNDHLFPAMIDISREVLNIVRDVRNAMEPWTPVIKTVTDGIVGMLGFIQKVTDGVSGLAKLPVAFAWIAVARLGWAKLTDAIALSTLRLRMFMGTAREMPGFYGAAAARFFGQGGSLDSAKFEKRGLTMVGVGGTGAADRVTRSRDFPNLGEMVVQARTVIVNGGAVAGGRAPAAPIAGGTPRNQYGRPIGPSLPPGYNQYNRPIGPRMPSANEWRYYPPEMRPVADYNRPDRQQGHRVRARAAAAAEADARAMFRQAASEGIASGVQMRSINRALSGQIRDAALAGFRKPKDFLAPMVSQMRTDMRATATMFGNRVTTSIKSGLSGAKGIAGSAVGGLGRFGKGAAGFGGLMALMQLGADAGNDKLLGHERIANALNTGTLGLSQLFGAKSGDQEMSERERFLQKFKQQLLELANQGKDTSKALRDVYNVGRGEGRSVGYYEGYQDFVKANDDIQDRIQIVRKLAARGLTIRIKSEVPTQTLKNLEAAFNQTARSAGADIRSIATNTRLSMRIIKQNTEKGSLDAKLALSRNFDEAIKAVRTSWRQGKVDAKDALEFINHITRKQLAEFGITGKQATRHINNQDTLTGKPLTTGKNDPSRGMARGGIIDIGDPRAKGRDSVPMVLNGQPVLAAEGESVAVLNRHQRAGLDHLAKRGGYGGLRDYIRSNNTPHYMARGGVIEAARGADMGTAAKPLSFFRHLAEQEGLSVSGARTPEQNAAVGGAAHSFHLTGDAIDVSGPADKMMSYAREVAGRWGSQLEELFYDPLGFFIKYGKRYPGAIGEHGDHVHVAETGGDAGATGPIPGFNMAGLAGPSWKNIKAPQTSLTGLIGSVVQGAIDLVTSGANKFGTSQLGIADGAIPGTTYEGPLNRVFPAGVQLSSGQVRRLLDSGGMPYMPLHIPWRESRFQPGIIGDDAAKGYGHTFGYGLLQVTTGVNGPAFDNVVASLGGWGQMLNPIKNIRASKWLSDHAGTPLGPWGATAAMGMLIEAALGFSSDPQPPSRGGPLPDTPAEVPPASQPDAKKKKKNKKSKGTKKLPATSGPGRPDLSKAKPYYGKKKNRKKKPVPQWIRDLLIQDGQEASQFLTDYQSLFGEPIENLEAAIGFISTEYDRTSEEYTVTLYDSAQYKDLTNWLSNHPEDLDGARDVNDFIDKYGNGIEVVNWDEMYVQGKLTRGVGKRRSELEDLLMRHTASTDGSGSGGLLGKYNEYLNATTFTGPMQLGVAAGVPINYLKQLRHAYNLRRDDFEQQQHMLKRLNSRGLTFEERIALLRGQIQMLDDYKRKITDESVGHRLTDEGKHNRNWATQQIADRRQEITELQQEQPGPILRNKPRRPTGKAATPAAMSAYRASMQDYNRRLRKYQRMYDNASATASYDRRTMDWISGQHGPSFRSDGGVASGWKTRLDGITENRKDLDAQARSLRNTSIPSEISAIHALQDELSTIMETRVMPRAIDNQPSTGTNDAEIAAMLREQLIQMRRQSAIDQAQFATLAGVQSMVQGRLVGAFASGGVVPETGYALVHRGEFINPAPDGPFRNGTNAAPGAGYTPNIALYVDGDVAPLLDKIRAMVDGRAVEIVNKTIGGRSRLLRASPGARG